MFRTPKLITTTMLAAAAAAAAAPAASANVALCVPNTPGQAAFSGGDQPGIYCNGSRTMIMPDSIGDQQKLIDLLPYITFQAKGIGGKPTIQIKGANLQVRKASVPAQQDGTGNLIVGDGGNYRDELGHTGSENLVVGNDNKWTGGNNALIGPFHTASGWGNTLVGRQSTSSGNHNFVSGVGNTASGSGGGMLGGYFNKLSGENSAIAGRQQESVTKNYAMLGDGAPNVHWAKFDANGKLLASSEPLEDHYGTSYYNLVKFRGVDLAKCSTTVQNRDSSGSFAATSSTDYYGYIYARAAKLTSTGLQASGQVAMDVTAVCDK